MRPDITMMYGDGTVDDTLYHINAPTIETAAFFKKHNAMAEFDRLVLALVSAGF